MHKEIDTSIILAILAISDTNSTISKTKYAVRQAPLVVLKIVHIKECLCVPVLNDTSHEHTLRLHVSEIGIGYCSLPRRQSNLKLIWRNP